MILKKSSDNIQRTMKRTQGHYDYEKRVYDDLGVDPNFYIRFVKTALRQIKGNKCEKCSGTVWLDVHHSSKEVISIKTLLLLCKKCHVKEHM